MNVRRLSKFADLFDPIAESDLDVGRLKQIIIEADGRPRKEYLEADAHGLHLLSDYGFWLLAPVLLESLEDLALSGDYSLLGQTALSLCEWSYFDDANRQTAARIRMLSKAERQEFHDVLARVFNVIRADEPYHFETETLRLWRGEG